MTHPPVERAVASGGLQVIEVMYGKADFDRDVCVDRSLAASDVLTSSSY